MDDPYEDFVSDYSWLTRGLLPSSEVADLATLTGVRSPGRVLDCSCGIGIDALALARAGYQVTGSDASARMVEASVRAVADAPTAVPVHICRWQSLPSTLTEPFDVVVCLGNSLMHTEGGDDMVASLRGMHAVLRPGGHLVVNSRDWDKLRGGIPLPVVVPSAPEGRDGTTCVPVYLWDFTPGWEELHRLEIALVLRTGTALRARRLRLDYRPFRFVDLVARLERAGFLITHSDHESQTDWYTVVAVRND